MFFDFCILAFLIILNGFFAMAELAIVSARKARLEVLAAEGKKRAKVALKLAERPGRFLSSIQVGITAIGVFSGLYSGAVFAQPLAEVLREYTTLTHQAYDLAVLIVVASVTYLTIIIGEIVPKQLALQYAETLAMVVSYPMLWFARIASPVVFLLEKSNRGILTLFGAHLPQASTVSEEEVKAMIAEGVESGAFEPDEKKMLDRVMKLDVMHVSSVMTPRKSMAWLDVNDTPEVMLEKLKTFHHSRYLACDGDVENLVGVIVVKDLLVHYVESTKESFDIRNCLLKPFHLPETTSMLDALVQFRSINANMAIIVDEYGSIQGVVTLKDIMRAIIGNVPEPEVSVHNHFIQRTDGSWLIDGAIDIHSMEEFLNVEIVKAADEDFQTLAGFVMYQLKRIPSEGDKFTYVSWEFEVVDMDGNRIDKVLLTTLQ